MIFIFTERGSKGSYNDYLKKFLVKFEEGMCSFLGGGGGGGVRGRKEYIRSFILTARLT
jgi:hypothetical protein